MINDGIGTFDHGDPILSYQSDQQLSFLTMNQGLFIPLIEVYHGWKLVSKRAVTEQFDENSFH